MAFALDNAKKKDPNILPRPAAFAFCSGRLI